MDSSREFKTPEEYEKYSDLEKKLYYMNMKIDKVNHIKACILENSVMIKKEIHSQMNIIVDLLRAREQKLCNEVEGLSVELDSIIQAELRRMYSGYAECHSILVNFMNNVEPERIVNSFNKCVADNFECAHYQFNKIRKLGFSSLFENLKSAIQTFGEITSENIQNQEIIHSYPDEYSRKFGNRCPIEDTSLNVTHSFTYEKPSESVESFEIVESTEDLTLQNNISEPVEGAKDYVEYCKSVKDINMGSVPSNYSNKSLRVSDWLDGSSETEYSIPSMDGVEKKIMVDPLYKFKKQLEKLSSKMCYNSRIKNQIDYTVKGNNCSQNQLSDQIPKCVHSNELINNPVTMTHNSLQREAYSPSSNFQQWLQKPSFYEYLVECNNPENTVFCTKIKKYSPAECIQQAFSSYIEKKDFEKWLNYPRMHQFVL